MSNSLAVATVTATLRNLLFTGVNQDLAGTAVTARPPDRARVNSAGNQVNLFLYQTGIEPAWRNQDMPGKVKPGEVGNPPMPLILHYLITTYGDTDDDLISHRLFGRAVSILHDHPRLERDELRLAFPGNDLYEQVERVHVTPQPLSVEELSKLWTTFQTPLRISAAYQACVILIESTQPVRSAPPVLMRGEDDRGPQVFTFIKPPFPEIEGAEFADGQPGARPGAKFTLHGPNLAADSVRILLNGRRLPGQVELAAGVPTDASVEVDLATSPVPLPAGAYSVTLILRTAGRDLQIRPFAFDIAPVVTGGLPMVVARVNGIATIDLQCAPTLVPGQEAGLIIGGWVIPAHTVGPNALSFVVPDLSVRDYFVRLRVDGVDSFLFDLSGPKPVYDVTQKVTVSA